MQAAPLALFSPQLRHVTPPSSTASFFHRRSSRLSVGLASSPRQSCLLRMPGESAACPPLLVKTSTSSVGYAAPGADIIGDLPVYSVFNGEAVLLRDLWDQNDWEIASDLRDAKSVFDAAGVKLIAVGVGTPDKARILAERLPFPLDCLYADPDRKLYDALGLYYGFRRTFLNPASAKVFSRIESLQKAGKNYTISATPDDRSSVLQQGGMFVFKGKQLLYARKDEGTGDHAPLDDILNVCCKVPAPAS